MSKLNGKIVFYKITNQSDELLPKYDFERGLFISFAEINHWPTASIFEQARFRFIRAHLTQHSMTDHRWWMVSLFFAVQELFWEKRHHAEQSTSIYVIKQNELIINMILMDTTHVKSTSKVWLYKIMLPTR